MSTFLYAFLTVLKALCIHLSLTPYSVLPYVFLLHTLYMHLPLNALTFMHTPISNVTFYTSNYL